MLTTATDRALHVRPATAGDVPAIVDLLAQQEFTHPLTKPQLARLFTQDWGVKPDHGMVLTAGDRGDRIVGVANTIYARPRPIGGSTTNTICSGTLFVLPRYRARRMHGTIVRYSEELARAIIGIGLPVSVFSARGPNDVVPEILRGIGFEEVCHADLFYPPGAELRSLLAPKGRIVSGPALEGLLTPEQRVVLDDHAPHGCRFYSVETGEGRAFVVTKRRWYKGAWLWPRVGHPRVARRLFPVSDILHLGAPDIAAAAWGRLVARVCLAERTVGVTCSRLFFRGTVPPGREIPQRIHAFGPASVTTALDKLYSEIVLLP